MSLSSAEKSTPVNNLSNRLSKRHVTYVESDMIVLRTTTNKRIIIFTRYPEAGTAKTRLIQTLGPDGAAKLQQRMTKIAINVCNRFFEGNSGSHVEIRYQGGSVALMTESFGKGNYRPQFHGNLGQRMLMAFEDAFYEKAEAVVLIGSDCPEITTELLAAAFDILTSHDLVLGPARDGGYYLIGMRRLIPELFPDAMPWGTSDVMETTLGKASESGVSVSLLPVLDDIDRPEDIAGFHNNPLLEGIPLSLICDYSKT